MLALIEAKCSSLNDPKKCLTLTTLGICTDVQDCETFRIRIFGIPKLQGGFICLILRRPFDFRIKKDGHRLDNLVIIMHLMKRVFVSSMKIGTKMIFAFGLKNKNEKVN